MNSKWGSNQWTNSGFAIIEPDIKWWNGGDVAATITTRSAAQDMPDKANFQAVLHPVAAYGIRTANTSSNGWGIQEEVTHTLDCAQGVAVAQPIAFHPTQDPISSTDGTTHAMGCGSKVGNATVAVAVRDTSPTITSNYGKQVDSSDTGLGPNVVFPAMQVRRLTPVECERLQGFPDGYTNIPWRGKSESPDGPRYKALGNSWAVPVVHWIGKRIDNVLKEKNS